MPRIKAVQGDITEQLPTWRIGGTERTVIRPRGLRDTLPELGLDKRAGRHARSDNAPTIEASNEVSDVDTTRRNIEPPIRMQAYP